MSETGLTDVIVDEVSEQVGVEGLVNGESLEEQIDAAEFGASVGQEFGAAIGRDLGEAVGREVHRTLSEGAENGKDLREIGADVTEAVLDVFRNLIESVEDRGSLRSFITEVTEEGGLGDLVTDAAPTDVLEDKEDGETGKEDERVAEETDEQAQETDDADDGEESTDTDDGEESADIDVDLEDLRKETLEDFLSLMSYQDLQSVAKDVGVKANLSRAEMTERIIDAVGDSAATTESA